MALSPAALDLKELHASLLAGFEQRLTDVGRSLCTTKNYRHHVKNLLKTYPYVPVESLTAEHIERHLFARKISARSKVAELAGLKAFFKYLMRQQRLVKKNPCDDVERPKYRDPLMPAPTFAEFEKLVGACRTLEERVVVVLFYQTAVRLREGISLKVKHVNLPQREVRVEHGKGDRDRVSVFDPQGLPAHLQLGPLLGRWMIGRDPDEWVFPARQGPGHRNHYWVQGVLRRLGEEVGLSFRLRPHLLRHGWVLWGAENDLPVEVAQAQLGHSSVSTTVGAYRKMTSPRLKRALDKYMVPVATNGHQGLDKITAPRYTPVVNSTETKEPGKNVQVGESSHEVLRKLAYVERRTIRSLLDEAVQILKDSRKK